MVDLRARIVDQEYGTGRYAVADLRPWRRLVDQSAIRTTFCVPCGKSIVTLWLNRPVQASLYECTESRCQTRRQQLTAGLARNQRAKYLEIAVLCTTRRVHHPGSICTPDSDPLRSAVRRLHRRVRSSQLVLHRSGNVTCTELVVCCRVPAKKKYRTCAGPPVEVQRNETAPPRKIGRLQSNLGRIRERMNIHWFETRITGTVPCEIWLALGRQQLIERRKARIVRDLHHLLGIQKCTLFLA